jgi:hypothetical protein
VNPYPLPVPTDGSAADTWAAVGSAQLPDPTPAQAPQHTQLINPPPQRLVEVRGKFIRRAGSSLNVDSVIGDGVLVSGVGPTLAITNPDRIRWLGYADLPDGRLFTVGDELVNSPNSQRMIWLDSDLHVRRVYEAPRADSGTWTLAPVAVGPHHIVTTTVSENNTKVALELVDIDNAANSLSIAQMNVGELGTVEVQGDTLIVHHSKLQYVPDENGNLTYVHAADGESVFRYHLDLVNFVVTPLAPLVVPPNTLLKFTDPARTEGVVAYASLPRSDGFHVGSFREGKPGSLEPLRPVLDKPVSGYVFGFDDNGRSYAFTGTGVEVHDRHGAKVASVQATGINNIAAIRHDGSEMVFLGGNEVVGLDARGERWRTPVWEAATIMFSPDEAHVLIGTRSGFVVLDPATGKRVDARCGWSFGIYDSNPGSRELGESPMCTE